MEREVMKLVTKKLQDMGYTVCYIALYGSQNYNMKYEKSDYDYKALVIPSLDDIVYNRKPTSTTIEHEWGGQVDVKDVRLMLDQWKKGAPNFMELLFTEWYDVPCPLFMSYFMQLRAKREEIAKANPKSTLKSMYGMMMEKFHALDHKYPAQAAEIEEKGYAAKQLCHLERIGAMMKRYYELPYELLTNPFLDNSDHVGSLREDFLEAFSIKTREFEFTTVEEAKAFGQKWLDECKPIVDECGSEFDGETYEFIDDMKGKILKTAFRAELKEEEGLYE
jgi:hypothetical protein